MSSPELPGRIILNSPGTRTLEMGAPSSSSLIVAPNPGPPGPQGPPGDDSDSFGYVHTQSTVAPANLPIQINHGFGYKPAGIVALENDGEQIEYATITHPLPGITELTFGVGFAGTIYLS